MRIEVTVNQKYTNKKFECFQEVVENAVSLLKIMKIKWNKMAKIKVSIPNYKFDALKLLEEIRSLLKHN